MYQVFVIRLNFVSGQKYQNLILLAKPDKKQTYHPRMTCISLIGVRWVRNGNLKIVCSQSHFSGTKMSTTFGFLFAPIKVDTSHHLRMNFTFSWGKTLYKRVPEGLFYRFSTKFAFSFSPLKTKIVIYVFAVFICSLEGTPGTRVPEGLFQNVSVLIFAPQNRVCSMFLELL